MYAFKKQMDGPGFFDNTDPHDLSTRPVDENRPIKVVVMGGGISGIIAGILFPRSIENLDLVIYEKNADIGGTWFENKLVLPFAYQCLLSLNYTEAFLLFKPSEEEDCYFDADCMPSSSYPGIACDIPSHVYQFTFESNTQWSSYYAPGSEIQRYLKRVATKYNAYKYMKFQHRVSKAEWNDSEGKWHVHVNNLDSGEVCSAFKLHFPDLSGLLEQTPII